MEVRFFFPCRFADQYPDGHMALVGAPLYLVSSEAFPTIIPAFSLAACIAFDREESTVSHSIHITMTDPQGGIMEILPEMTIPPRDIEPGLDTQLVNPILHIQGFLASNAGVYQFVLYVDGENAKEAPFRLRGGTPSPDLQVMKIPAAVVPNKSE